MRSRKVNASLLRPVLKIQLYQSAISSTNMDNSKIYAGLLVLALIAIGGYFFPQGNTVIQKMFGSPGNATFLGQPAASVIFNLSAGTTTSILNTDASDRYITTFQASCSGITSIVAPYLGVNSSIGYFGIRAATTTFNAATGTPTANVLVSNSNFAASTTVATSSAITVMSTSTAAATMNSNQFSQEWAAGSYLTFITNATSSGTCTVGVMYLPS